MGEWITKYLMWVSIVDQDEQGILLHGGKFQRVLDPGWYVTIPFFDRVWTTNVNPQVIDLPDQVLEIGGVTHAISVSLEYVVDNIHDALLKVQDYEDAIVVKACELTLKYQADMEVVEDELSTIAEKWGLNILNVSLNQKAPCYVLKLLQ